MNTVRTRSGDHVRRVQDLMRMDILSGAHAGDALPSEQALQHRYAASRAGVRGSLALLEREGLLVRVRGQGTFVVHDHIEQDLREMHGVDSPSPSGLWSGRMSTRVLDWSSASASPPVAQALKIAEGEPVLRMAYVALLNGVPLWCTTNYLRQQDARTLSREMMRVDFYEMLRAGGFSIGHSLYRIDAGVADEFDVAELGAKLGQPVLALQQVIADEEGRPVVVAYARTGTRGLSWVSRASQEATELGEA